MIREKIKNWLQKQKYDIDIEINPAITLFGILTFSFAKAKVDPNPDKWSEEERKIIADTLDKELKISLAEFSKCLKEEIEEKKKEELDSILNQIAELITEKPLIPLREFEERPEIKPLLEYKKFIGRQEELKELHTFLADDSKKIMVVSGEGGTGKTRLAIEFARQTEDKNWSVYFIHPVKLFKCFGVIPSSGKILLILDDASRYIYRDKLIDCVLNPPVDSDIKLLLIARTIFKDRIESNLREKGVSVEAYEIKKGDIISFLEENLGIEENTAVEIERECRDSFIWAAFFAEFYREEGRVDEIREVLINRTEKYIQDLKLRAEGMAIEDVKKILSLLSLVTPVKWKEDKKYFKEIFEESLPEYEYEHLRRIIGLAGETNILLMSDDEYAIKPDPVADFLRTEFMGEKRFNRVVKSLLPCMPLRISYNIHVISSRFKAEKIEEVHRALGEIWVELNRINGRTPEYFSALVFFTGDLESLFFADKEKLAVFIFDIVCDIEKANVSQWIRCYKDIHRTHPEKEVREELAKGLSNVARHYGGKDKFEKMEKCIKELRELHNAHPDKEVRERLAKGLGNAANYYGRADEFESMENWTKELRELHNAHPDKEVRELLAKSLFNAMEHYRIAGVFEKMGGYIKELRELHNRHPDNEVRQVLSIGLVTAMNHYKRADDSERGIGCLIQLTKLLSLEEILSLRQVYL